MRRITELETFEFGLEEGVDVKGQWCRSAIRAPECEEGSFYHMSNLVSLQSEKFINTDAGILDSWKTRILGDVSLRPHVLL